jgi:hypothetical protein
METEAALKSCKTFLDWVLAIFHEWITLACGGVIMAGWWAISSFRGIAMSPQQFIWIAGLFVFLASFKAWKREREKVLLLTRAKYDKPSSEITQHIMALSRRLSAVIGFPGLMYNPDTDDETHEVIANIDGWVLAELNQDGEKLWCSGVLEIHGSDLLANQFSTMYDRNRAETEARLKRRIDNLKAIKADIGNYIRQERRCLLRS